jgi:hypothetical protein
MAAKEPAAELDPRFSSDDAEPTPWTEGRRHRERAEVYWLATVRPDGRPHVAPLLAVWLDGALYFSTGPGERKAKNLASNPRCVITTGCNTQEGLDLVVEGDAVRVIDDAKLRRVAELYEAKYGSAWRFEVRDGAFYHGSVSLRETDPGAALVFEIAPMTAFGFGKGDSYSQTRWRF